MKWSIKYQHCLKSKTQQFYQSSSFARVDVIFPPCEVNTILRVDSLGKHMTKPLNFNVTGTASILAV